MGGGVAGGGGGGGGGIASAAAGAIKVAAATGGGFTDSQNAARINVTVNGAIDPEGTARTIVKTLNDSFYRGTGGASALQAI
jgi:hypothetical protein